MSNIPSYFLVALLSTVIGLGFANQSDAQLQDAIWEKGYCLDERGNVISFDYSAGVVPPYGTERNGAGLVVGDTEALYEFSPLTAQFLFTRACLQAASINMGANVAERIECQAARFLARRFNMSPHESLKIVDELSQASETREIARALRFCE